MLYFIVKYILNVEQGKTCYSINNLIMNAFVINLKILKLIEIIFLKFK